MKYLKMMLVSILRVAVIAIVLWTVIVPSGTSKLSLRYGDYEMLSTIGSLMLIDFTLTIVISAKGSRRKRK